MYLSQTAAPSVTPVSLAEAKAHLRVTHSDDDTAIGSLIDAATAHFDGAAGALSRALIAQSWEWRLDEFPASWDGAISLPLPPLQTVESVKYIDIDGIEQTLASSVYVVDVPGKLPGRIRLGYAQFYPSTRIEAGAVRIRFTAGYGAAGADVPMPIRQAMLLWIGFLYANRELSSIETGAIEALIAPYRLRRI